MLTLIVMAVFVIRLFYLQVIRHSYYVEMASSEQMRQLVIPAKRGEIYALDKGSPVRLVLNQVVYTVFADPQVVDDPDKVVKVIERVAGGSARQNLSGLLSQKESRYQILATNVTRKQAELIKEEKLAGVGFQEGTRRVYPEGRLAAQVLGFVNAEGEGRYGVEGYMDERLAGEDGLLRSVTDIRNVPLTIGDNNINIPAKDGDNVVLTIDRNIQAYTEQALADGLKRSGATHGSVTVMDPQTGRVLAMANLPTYDPAEYGKVDDIGLFNNPAVSSPFEPGSVLKTFTLGVGIDKGVIRPDSRFNNTDLVVVGGERITNATRGQTGNITMQTALDFSLNTGMVHIARLLGDGDSITLGARSTIYEYFHDKLRLGHATGVELAGEVRGTIVPPDDPNGAAVRYSNMTFGQGLDVTMLQVVAGFSALINGGTYHAPTIVAGVVDDSGNLHRAEPTKSDSRVVKPETSKQLREMVHKGRQAFHGNVDRSGYYIGGKTGTSQTVRDGRYIVEETIGTYLGFGGAVGEPSSYVIMVQVSGKDMNLHGNRDAMPIFTDISNWMIDYLQLQPKR